MSFFSEFLHALFGGTSHSSTEKSLSLEEIHVLVSGRNVSSLSGEEIKSIAEAIDKGRKGDGKISLASIDHVLLKLFQEKKISEYDRRGMMKVFENYLGSR